MPLLYSSVPSQQSEAKVRAKSRVGEVSPWLARPSPDPGRTRTALTTYPIIDPAGEDVQGLVPSVGAVKAAIGTSSCAYRKKKSLMRVPHATFVCGGLQQSKCNSGVVVHVCNPSTLVVITG